MKPTALSPLFSALTGPEALDGALARLRPVLERARTSGATVHLGTEHDETKDLTYELLRRIGSEFRDVQLGCVVEAYRRDSEADLRAGGVVGDGDLEVPLRVRLVKEAYWDHEGIVAGAAGWRAFPLFADKADTGANFERCRGFLIDHAGEVRPAIATHNLRSLAHPIAAYGSDRRLEQSGLELQLLYSMAEPVHTCARARRVPRARLCAGGGARAGNRMHLVRRLLENTSNESFVRHRFAEGRSSTILIRAPVTAAGASAAVDGDVDAATPVRLATDTTAPGPFVNEPHAELRRRPARAAAVV